MRSIALIGKRRALRQSVLTCLNLTTEYVNVGVFTPLAARSFCVSRRGYGRSFVGRWRVAPDGPRRYDTRRHSHARWRRWGPRARTARRLASAISARSAAFFPTWDAGL